jgi:hypothetical protein
MTDEIVPKTKREYGFWMMVLSSLTGTMPLISIFQKVFDIGLVPILFDAVTYYRNLLYPLIDRLFYFLSFLPLPDFYKLLHSSMSFETYKDLVILSFVSATAWSRSLISDSIRLGEITTNITGLILLGFTWLLTLFGGVSLVALAYPMVGIWSILDREDRFLVGYMLSLVVAFAAAGAFFAMNELMK